jgi:hypothetical protein
MVVRRWNQLKSDEPDAFDDKLVRARDKRKHTAETAYPSLVFPWRASSSLQPARDSSLSQRNAH